MNPAKQTTAELRQSFAQYIIHLADTTTPQDIVDERVRMQELGETLKNASPNERDRIFNELIAELRTEEGKVWEYFMVNHYADPLIERIRRDVVRMFIEAEFDARQIKLWAAELLKSGTIVGPLHEMPG